MVRCQLESYLELDEKALARTFRYISTFIRSYLIMIMIIIFLDLRFLKERRESHERPVVSHIRKSPDCDTNIFGAVFVCLITGALFFHGLCPDCAEKYYGEYLHHEKDMSPDESTKDEI